MIIRVLRLITGCLMGGFGLTACAANSNSPRSVGAETISLPAAERELIRAVLDSIARPLPPGAALCVQLMGGPSGPVQPDQALLNGLATRRQAVAMTACPRTYAQMVARLDSAGRPMNASHPPDYVDPVQLTVGRPQFERVGYAWIYVRQLQGTAGKDYICVGQSYEGRVSARCHTIRMWLH